MIATDGHMLAGSSSGAASIAHTELYPHSRTRADSLTNNTPALTAYVREERGPGWQAAFGL